jgi:DNA helicase II / ATP-dependent DNA helicase PcrA
LLNNQHDLIAAIRTEDIGWACAVMGLEATAFSGVDGLDPRLEVLRSLETLDIEACPGSGKTTLLVAKLAILANHWRSQRQGICVLSHTNAARNEIGNRLGPTTAGNSLLHYPHFVGTIHSFVNEFLAIPWLSSKGNPMRAVDTDIALNVRWARLPHSTKFYLDRQHLDRFALTYEAADFSGGRKSRYSQDTQTHKEMLKVCMESASEGLFCYDEMFVWACNLVDTYPIVVSSLRKRFPFVFIDEVQDNSELQSAFLHRLFCDGDAPSIRQRFGDSNQAIYQHTGQDGGAKTDAFPSSVKKDLPNSFRFGQQIADVSNPLAVIPQGLIGCGPPKNRKGTRALQNILILFDDAAIERVLPTYAEYLTEVFSAEELAAGDFTAVAGVHRPGDGTNLPRSLGDYAPAYDPSSAGSEAKPATFLQYLAKARSLLAGTSGSHPVVSGLADGIIKFIRLAKKDLPLSLRRSSHRYLVEQLHDKKERADYFSLVDGLVMSRGEVTKQKWDDARDVIIAISQLVVGLEITDKTVLAFLDWTEIEGTGNSEIASRAPVNVFEYPVDQPKVRIRLGSIHSVKGETHTATLVLESYYKAHHLKLLKPWLLGKKPKTGKSNAAESEAISGRLKLHYVAMTRPSHLLCLAMRRDTFQAGELDEMEKRWKIVDCAAVR